MQSGNNEKTLLHACCGPCSLEPTRILREEGHNITIFYANSNIAPSEEYEHRLDTLRSWAHTEEIDVVEGPYDHELWKERIIDAQHLNPGVRAERCRACYRLRFEQAAKYASEQGFSRISTTLSVSPYQYTDIIREELERAAELYGITVEFRDFRPQYDEATRRSRALGMYRQNYCGCEFSDKEASDERVERKRLREQERKAYLESHAEEIEQREKEREAKRTQKAEYEAKQARKHELQKALKAEKRQ